jgi:uncharacterized LabA/DUF88 family protein
VKTVPLNGLALPSDPHLLRWMLFVDGENFAIRAKAFAAARSIDLVEGENYQRDVFVWLPGVACNRPLTNNNPQAAVPEVRKTAVRAYYYTSCAGDHDKLRNVEQSLWNLGFTPRVFKKPCKGTKSKGVDIAMTTDVLSHAYQDHYDVAVLLSGDADYVPVVNQLKRIGKIVLCLSFDNSSFSNELKLASDRSISIDPLFEEKWGSTAVT